jgi:peptidoglycan/xylan/chitin deacetylase (PgdA/CDA1 family)
MNKIALTFDDSPYTSLHEILHILDQYEEKATFFIISGQVTTQYKEILKQAIKNGHQLGNHGHTNSMHALKSHNVLSDEITKCDNIIKQIYSEANVPLPKQMVYRPGCGLFNSMMLKLVKKLNYKLALGSVYPNDPIVIFPLINYLYLTYHIDHGDIIILHDRRWTPQMLEMLLQWMNLHKFQSVTLDEILQ